MPLTPFGGPFWNSKCQEMEGDMKNEGENKTNGGKGASTHFTNNSLTCFHVFAQE